MSLTLYVLELVRSLWGNVHYGEVIHLSLSYQTHTQQFNIDFMCTNNIIHIWDKAEDVFLISKVICNVLSKHRDKLNKRNEQGNDNVIGCCKWFCSRQYYRNIAVFFCM